MGRTTWGSSDGGPPWEDRGVTEREVPSRHNWLPSALPALFGEEPVLSVPWPAIRDVVAAFGVQAESIRDQALHGATELDVIDAELSSADGGSWTAWHGPTVDFHAPMRVVLMGRTMAGKASLLSALSSLVRLCHEVGRRAACSDSRAKSSTEAVAGLDGTAGRVEALLLVSEERSVTAWARNP